MFSIADNIQNVRKRIKKASELTLANDLAVQSGGVQLLAVTKKRSAGELKLAMAEGLLQFGENYLSEALDKQQALQKLVAADDFVSLNWYFIGPIQSNKTRLIAENFDWVQSIDRLKIAQRLNDQRPADLGRLNICIQVNIDNEDSKSGIKLSDVDELANAIGLLPNLVLRGLMCIPKASQSDTDLRTSYYRMYTEFIRLKKLYSQVDTLSMGMSADIETAIAGGSSMVRVGTDLFGQRS